MTSSTLPLVNLREWNILPQIHFSNFMSWGICQWSDHSGVRGKWWPGPTELREDFRLVVILLRWYAPGIPAPCRAASPTHPWLLPWRYFSSLCCSMKMKRAWCTHPWIPGSSIYTSSAEAADAKLGLRELQFCPKAGTEDGRQNSQGGGFPARDLNHYLAMEKK